ncbi:MAG: DNA polymerase III subunit gamma/tau [Candidatus Latescibacteria bacterium]|nr:DNA polymerase III subunit gamma/tau [Candidatus Latescibacterota bacterium]
MELAPAMSYIVTARKWRPQFFRDVISQHHVTETLKNAIKSGRVGHAYLFSGPRGVGKTTVARIFAKALNCVNGPAEEPCNVCENCKSIQSGSSLDVQEQDGASNNKVEDVRNLIANIGYHASHCRYKMYIIDEVHMLSDSAFNALLKTLEEPPPNVIFVFATTEPQKIPVTVLSRCQRFDFHRLSVHDIAGKMKKIADAEDLVVDDSALLLIARRATGAMRDAESILEQLRASRGSGITVADVNEVLGIADREVFFNIIEKCHSHDTRGILEVFTTYYDEGGDLKEFAEGLLGHLRDLLYSRFEEGLDQVMVSDDMRSRIKEQSDWFQQSDIIRMIQTITDVETSLAYAVMPVLRIETALARMSLMETTVQLKSLFDQLGGKAVLNQTAETQQNSSVSVSTESDVSYEREIAEIEQNMVYIDESDDSGDEALECLNIDSDIESITASWQLITDRVGSVKPGIGPSLTVGKPESFEHGKLTLSFGSEQEFHKKAVESNLNMLEEIIGAFIGLKVTIKCFMRHTGVEKKKTEVEDIINREPIIEEILKRFDGEINGLWGEKNG